MKRKSVFSFLAAGTMAMGLLLGAGATSAATVLFADGGTKATGIDDVNIGGTVYDVTFNVQVFAFEEYGPFPGTFFFNNATVALDEMEAVPEFDRICQGPGEDVIVDLKDFAVFAVDWMQNSFE